VEPSSVLITFAFLALVLGVTGARVWLARRQVAHIAAHRDAVPTAFANVIDGSAHARAADYSIAKTRHGLRELLVSTAVLLLLTLGGGIAWADVQIASWLGSDSLLHGVLLVGAVMAFAGLVELPLAWQRVFGIEQRFGFNRMSRSLFVRDLVMRSTLTGLIGAPLILLVLWIMQETGSLWWLWAWAVWVAFNVGVMALYPTVFAPLFNTFSRLPEGELKQRIETLLARCGFTSNGLYVIDSSKRSSHGNAYFAGFGAAKRIVLFDTLINRLSPTEVEAVLAHELGHYRRNHVRRRLALIFGVSLAVLALMGWLLASPLVYGSLGLERASTPGALLLVFLTVPYLVFLIRPLLAGYSRKHEFEADAYAAEHADGGALVDALVKLYKDNASTLTPDPVHSAVYDSHPPAAHRISRLRQLAAAPA